MGVRESASDEFVPVVVGSLRRGASAGLHLSLYRRGEGYQVRRRMEWRGENAWWKGNEPVAQVGRVIVALCLVILVSSIVQ
jgi:hypothetical protein